jgi:hypothetical protein
MKFADLARRLTGISTPVIGISWQPEPSETDAARRVLVFLEDRRVLYEPSELEVPEHCVESVLRIREYLTKELGDLDGDSPLGSNLRAIRAACRKFLRMVDGHRPRLYPPGAYQRWVFDSALGELRGVVGVHVALIAERYGIEVDTDLSRILPEPVE